MAFDITAQDKPFHKFQGWRLLALFIVTIAYSYWFSVIGPYSKLAALAPGMPLESAGFYSGEHAAQVLGALDGDGRKTKYVSLAFDVPFMILNWLLAEALIAFGLRRMNLSGGKWRLLFAVPLTYLILDVLEGAALALTLATGSAAIGTVAGIMTPLKMGAYSLAAILGLIMAVSGLIAWAIRKARPNKQD